MPAATNAPTVAPPTAASMVTPWTGDSTRSRPVRCGQLPDLELRHRRRARCEDRIQSAKVTGLQNLPFHGSGQNRIWPALVQLACDLLGASVAMQSYDLDEDGRYRLRACVWEKFRLGLTVRHGGPCAEDVVEPTAAGFSPMSPGLRRVRLWMTSN